MFNYAVADAEGNVLGVLVLTEEAKKMFFSSFVKNRSFRLLAGLNIPENKIINFTVLPEDTTAKSSANHS